MDVFNWPSGQRLVEQAAHGGTLQHGGVPMLDMLRDSQRGQADCYEIVRIVIREIARTKPMVGLSLQHNLFMTPQDLAQHKAAPKRMASAPAFFKAKGGPKLPKPFQAMRGPRMYATGEIQVSDTHCAFFFWRDGSVLTDRAFFAWLMCKLSGGQLYPLFEMHYHPSHKGVHAKLPCETQLDYTARQLPQAPEFQLKTHRTYDPAKEADRLALVNQFCDVCGIQMGQGGGLWN